MQRATGALPLTTESKDCEYRFIIHRRPVQWFRFLQHEGRPGGCGAPFVRRHGRTRALLLLLLLLVLRNRHRGGRSMSLRRDFLLAPCTYTISRMLSPGFLVPM